MRHELAAPARALDHRYYSETYLPLPVMECTAQRSSEVGRVHWTCKLVCITRYPFVTLNWSQLTFLNANIPKRTD